MQAPRRSRLGFHRPSAAAAAGSLAPPRCGRSRWCRHVGRMRRRARPWIRSSSIPTAWTRLPARLPPTAPRPRSRSGRTRRWRRRGSVARVAHAARPWCRLPGSWTLAHCPRPLRGRRREPCVRLRQRSTRRTPSRSQPAADRGTSQLHHVFVASCHARRTSTGKRTAPWSRA